MLVKFSIFIFDIEDLWINEILVLLVSNVSFGDNGIPEPHWKHLI